MDRNDFSHTVETWRGWGLEQAASKVREVYEGGEGTRRSRAEAQKLCGPHFSVLARLTPVPTRGKPKRKVDSEVLKTALDYRWTMDDFEGYDLGYAGLFTENPWRSLAKYAHRWDDPDEETYKKARRWVYEDERPYLADIGPSNHDVAIAALDGRKSPGAPWNRVYQNTADMLAKQPDHMQKVWDLTGHDDRYVYLWVNSEKEEMRAAEKLADRKIRTFVASSKEMVYMSRRLFGPAYEAWIDAHRELNHGIGFNKFDGGWDRLARKMHTHPNSFGADVDGRDGSVSLDDIVWFSNLEWNYLPSEERTPENYRRFNTILKSRCFSLVVDPDGFVWMIPGGVKSGDPKTIQLNTWKTRAEFYYAWITLVGDDREYFKKHCVFDITGDDVWFSVSDDVVERFNITTVADLIRRAFNVVWTTDCKWPRSAQYVPYLSNYSIVVAGMWVPRPVSPKTMNGWLKATKQDTPAMSLIRSWAAYRELYWNVSWRHKIRLHIRRLMRTYGHALRDDPDWKLALTSATTENEVELLWGVCRK